MLGKCANFFQKVRKIICTTTENNLDIIIISPHYMFSSQLLLQLLMAPVKPLQYLHVFFWTQRTVAHNWWTLTRAYYVVRQLFAEYNK